MDICQLVEDYIEVSARCGIADTRRMWETKRAYMQQLDRLELIMAEHCVQIDERENPMITIYNAKKDPTILYFFHVRRDGAPWKKLDIRTKSWSEWRK
jgi:hypothetical protein